jgi:hypothetical protein
MIVVTGRYGSLGNRLWTYANILAFGLEHGIGVVNPAFRLFAQAFEGNVLAFCGKRHEHLCRLLASEAVQIGGWDFLYKLNLRLCFFPTIELGETSSLSLDADNSARARFLSHPIVFLSGFYFGAAQSLMRRGADIRRVFSPRETIMVRVQECIRKAKQLGDLLVGVHMRQGDYRNFCEGLMFYTTQEYVDVMRQLQAQRPEKRVVFLICSDEEQCRDSFEGLRTVFGPSDAIGDLYSLAYCDYIFGPNSSFSQWASFWGNVPLHVLDWRTALTYGNFEPIFNPLFDKHFIPFDPAKFSQYSRGEISLKDVLPLKKRTNQK